MESLGQCDDLDSSFITNPKGLKYFSKINQKAPPKKYASLHKLMNLQDSTLRDILRPMLEVNPYFRPTAKELLKHKYFDEVRIAEYEHSSTIKLSL